MDRKQTNKPDAKSDSHRQAKDPAVTMSDAISFPDLTTFALTPQMQSVVSMQRIVGNAAVQRMMTIQRQVGAPAEAAPDTERAQPSWARNSRMVGRIQRQLRRLGLYTMTIDRLYGRGTDAALVEAFGGDEFRTLEGEVVLERLTAAAPPERAEGEARGEHALRYGEMFRDGILDMTVAVGFDEGPWAQLAHDAIVERLGERSFVQNNDRARVLMAQAGRAMQTGDVHQYFIRENALNYQPPAGSARSIHAVVHVIFNRDGTGGAEAADSFRDGLIESDATYYAGHGRYGSGPDFDRNFASFVLQPLPGETGSPRTILNYNDLEQAMEEERVRSHSGARSAWRQFLWRHRSGLIQVNFSNAGNIRINRRNLHPGEFGSDLINWALEQGHIESDTGRGGELADRAAAHPERRYRVVVFDGCRTQDYETSIRSTPGLGAGTTDTIESTRVTYWSDKANGLAAFLDSILRQQSAEQIVRGIDDQQEGVEEYDHHARSGTFRHRGGGYNPVVR